MPDSRFPCLGDTDGDGNCPLPLCPHCHPENFTEAQLDRLLAERESAP